MWVTQQSLTNRVFSLLLTAANVWSSTFFNVLLFLGQEINTGLGHHQREHILTEDFL